MGRVIHTTHPTRQRVLLMRKMAAAIRGFTASAGADREAADLAASLIGDLREMRESVDRTAEAWEKRNYWIKADAFRRQWAWVDAAMAGLSGSLSSADGTDLQRHIRGVEKKIAELDGS